MDYDIGTIVMLNNLQERDEVNVNDFLFWRWYSDGSVNGAVAGRWWPSVDVAVDGVHHVVHDQIKSKSSILVSEANWLTTTPPIVVIIMNIYDDDGKVYNNVIIGEEEPWTDKSCKFVNTDWVFQWIL